MVSLAVTVSKTGKIQYLISPVHGLACFKGKEGTYYRGVRKRKKEKVSEALLLKQVKIQMLSVSYSQSHNDGCTISVPLKTDERLASAPWTAPHVYQLLFSLHRLLPFLTMRLHPFS